MKAYTPVSMTFGRNELDELYDAYHHDTFKLIAVVFKLGFARGQKAVKKA